MCPETATPAPRFPRWCRCSGRCCGRREGLRGRLTWLPARQPGIFKPAQSSQHVHHGNVQFGILGLASLPYIFYFRFAMPSARSTPSSDKSARHSRCYFWWSTLANPTFPFMPRRCSLRRSVHSFTGTYKLPVFRMSSCMTVYLVVTGHRLTLLPANFHLVGQYTCSSLLRRG